MAVSMKPSSFADVALMDDVDFEVVQSEFTVFEYGGKGPKTPALHWKMKVGEDEHDQYWTVGSAADWQPSEDGKQLLPIGKNKQLNSGSNVAILLTSLVNAGMPEDMIGEDASVFVGLKGHANRIPAPKRPGLKKEGDRETTILTVTAIHSLPGEKAKKSTAKKAAAAEASGGDGDASSQATSVMLDILAEKGGTVEKRDIPGLVMTKIKDLPAAERNAVLKLAYTDEFLGTGPWTYADGTVTL